MTTREESTLGPGRQRRTEGQRSFIHTTTFAFILSGDDLGGKNCSSAVSKGGLEGNRGAERRPE